MSTTNKSYMQLYYAKHRNKLLQYNKEKIQCPKCYKTVSRNHMSYHQQSHLCKIQKCVNTPLLNLINKCDHLRMRMLNIISNNTINNTFVKKQPEIEYINGKKKYIYDKSTISCYNHKYYQLNKTKLKTARNRAYLKKSQNDRDNYTVTK